EDGVGGKSHVVVVTLLSGGVNAAATDADATRTACDEARKGCTFADCLLKAGCTARGDHQLVSAIHFPGENDVAVRCAGKRHVVTQCDRVAVILSPRGLHAWPVDDHTAASIGGQAGECRPSAHLLIEGRRPCSLNCQAGWAVKGILEQDGPISCAFDNGICRD